MKTKNIKMYSRTAVRLCGHCYCLLVLLLAFTGCKKDDDKSADTPPLAATTQTWTFGDQIWSDAIQCPECNKETFENSVTEPQCRRYADPESGRTFYYYNWPYVNANADKMCPSPWRVPTYDDMRALYAYVYAPDPHENSVLADAWGAGVYDECCPACSLCGYAWYWSSSITTEYPEYACAMGFSPTTRSLGFEPRYAGQQVRCVK